MQDQAREIRSQTKERLRNLLKAAVSGVVVATVTLTTPVAQAPASPSLPKTALEQRVKELQKNIHIAKGAKVAEEMLAWGNHWHNWHNWHNW